MAGQRSTKAMALGVEIGTLIERESSLRGLAPKSLRGLLPQRFVARCQIDQIIAEGRFHAGIVVAQQQRYSTGEELRRLMRLIGRRTQEEMRNRIEFLSAWA
jgi:hypothetical protein